MAMLITTIANIKASATPQGFLLFCQEQGIDAESYSEPEEGVMVGKMDLYRYGAAEAASDLNRSVRRLLDDLSATPS